MTDENKKKIYKAVRDVCLRAVTGWDAEIDEDNFEEIVDEDLIDVIDQIIEKQIKRMKYFLIRFVFAVCVVGLIATACGMVYSGLKGDTESAFVCSCGCACYIFAAVALFDIIKKHEL